MKIECLPPISKTKNLVLLAWTKGYKITENGKVIGKRGKELKLSTKQRYPTISVNVGNLTKSRIYGVPAHQLAAFCFYGKDFLDENLIVRHLDSNTQNLRKDNIVLGTHSDNNLDKSEVARKNAAKIARKSQGYRAKNAMFSDDTIREIRKLLECKTQSEIARIFNTSKAVIHNIKKGISYKNVM